MDSPSNIGDSATTTSVDDPDHPPPDTLPADFLAAAATADPFLSDGTGTDGDDFAMEAIADIISAADAEEARAEEKEQEALAAEEKEAEAQAAIDEAASEQPVESAAAVTPIAEATEPEAMSIDEDEEAAAVTDDNPPAVSVPSAASDEQMEITEQQVDEPTDEPIAPIRTKSPSQSPPKQRAHRRQRAERLRAPNSAGSATSTDDDEDDASSNRSSSSKNTSPKSSPTRTRPRNGTGPDRPAPLRPRKTATSCDSSSDYVADSSDGYNQSPDLEHIMSDHNYFNHTGSQRPPPPAVEDEQQTGGSENGGDQQSDGGVLTDDVLEDDADETVIAFPTASSCQPTLTDLLLAVQQTLASGSPVYDTPHDMLALVTALVLSGNSATQPDVLQTLVEQVDMLRVQHGVSQEIDAIDATPPIAPIAEPIAAPPPTNSDRTDAVFDADTGEALRKLRAFGHNITELQADMAEEVLLSSANADDIDPVSRRRTAIGEFAHQMEEGFAERMRELRLAAGITVPEEPAEEHEEEVTTSEPFEEMSMQRSPSTDGMEQLVYDTESDAEEEKKEGEEEKEEENGEKVEEEKAVEAAEPDQPESTPTTPQSEETGATETAEVEPEPVATAQEPEPAPATSSSSASDLNLNFIEPPNDLPPLNVFASDDETTPAEAAKSEVDKPADEEETEAPEPADKPVEDPPSLPPPPPHDDDDITATPAEEFEHFERSLAQMHEASASAANNMDTDTNHSEEDTATEAAQPTIKQEPPLDISAEPNPNDEPKADDDSDASLDYDAVMAANGLSLPGDGGRDDEHVFHVFDAVCEIDALSPSRIARVEKEAAAKAAREQKVEKESRASSPDGSDNTSDTDDSAFAAMPVEVEMSSSSDAPGAGEAAGSGAAEAKKTKPTKKSTEGGGGDDDEDEDEDIDDEDRDIQRLLDFSSLANRKRPADGTYYVAAKKPEPPPKPAKPTVDTLMDELAQPDNEAPSTSAAAAAEALKDSDDEDAVMTEEKFLLQCNEAVRDRLLAMSSSGSESEMEEDVGAEDEEGEKDEDDEEDDEDDEEDDKVDDDDDNSRDSAIDLFLQAEAAKKPKRLAATRVNGTASASASASASDAQENAAQIDSPTFTNHVGRSDANRAKPTPNAAAPAGPTDDDDDDDDTSADEAAIAAATAAKRQRAEDRPIFGDLDKYLEDDEDDDDNGDESGRQGKGKTTIKLDALEGGASDRSSLSSDCELLDTSMFKAAAKASKQINDRKLSRHIRASQRRQIDADQLAAALAAAADPKASAAGDKDSAAAAALAVAAAAAKQDDCISLSSDTDLEELDEDVVEVPAAAQSGSVLAEAISSSQQSGGDKTRAGPRKMLRADQLADETKEAQTEEKERVKRLEKKAERLQQLAARGKDKTALPSGLEESDVVLDYDSKLKQRITVHPDIVKHLKPHQVDGVKFMYDSCYGSVDDKSGGSGCILAHCMGLGKTLQLIALLHSLIRHVQLKTNKILVICPKSTVMNWAEEIERWLGPVRGGPSVKVYQFPDASDVNEKLRVLREWQNSGKSGYAKAGCLLIGYEAFRTLVFYHLSKKRKFKMVKEQLDSIRRKVEETLLKPGADIVICDEGHMIKNRKSATSLAVNEIRTRKRIILTGTPIQNNLKEYYSMVNFIKPSFLGTEKEFANLYANPIRIGQHKDSSKGEIKFMKQRSYVLHKKLSKFVQRREAALLKTFLPEKYEYVLFIPMTDVQNRLYVHFLENNPLKDKYGGKSLIPDYTFLRKIWTHPKVLESAYNNALMLQRKKDAQAANGGGRWGKAQAKAAAAAAMNALGAMGSTAGPGNASDSDVEQPDDVLDQQTGSMSVTSSWWKSFVTAEDLESLLPSNKLRTLFEILQMCQENGEKCLVFSAFVAVLDVVEFFMRRIHEHMVSGGAVAAGIGLERYRGPWETAKDYYRLDGKTPKSIRHAMITRFNDVNNTRTRCFLISAKAGGQGINLIGANRVVLLDTSWNPSNDQQNIFRVFRLGQKNKCYIYRLLGMGTMEEKVYSRSVTKQAMSFRVVDEQQIDRHYSMAELAELYTLTIPDYAERPTPVRPYDNVLASLLRNFSELVYKYHEHDSLLEQNSEQDLSEEEKADAWAAYEKDVSLKNQYQIQLNSIGDSFGQLPGGPGGHLAGHPMAGLFGAGSMFGGLNMPPPYGTAGSHHNPHHPHSHHINPYMPGGSYNPYSSGPGPGSYLDKDLLMISQMYNTPYASLLNNLSGNLGGPGPSASSASGSGGPSGSSSTSMQQQQPPPPPSPYLPFGSLPPSAYNTNFGLSEAASAAAQIQQEQQALLASLNRMMPPRGGGGPSTSSAGAGGLDINSMLNLDKAMWPYMSAASASQQPHDLTTSSPSQSLNASLNSSGSSGSGGAGSILPTGTAPTMVPGAGGQSQPGPNARRNPLLYKELAGTLTGVGPSAAAAASSGSPAMHSPQRNSSPGIRPGNQTSVITSVGPPTAAAATTSSVTSAAPQTPTTSAPTTGPTGRQGAQQQQQPQQQPQPMPKLKLNPAAVVAAAASAAAGNSPQHRLRTASPAGPKRVASPVVMTVGQQQQQQQPPTNKNLSRAAAAQPVAANRRASPLTISSPSSNKSMATASISSPKSKTIGQQPQPHAAPPPTVINLGSGGGSSTSISNNGASSSSSSAAALEPEPHLIVKNVSAINQMLKASAAGGGNSPKSKPTPPAPIKNFNMGIVYPSKSTPKVAASQASENTAILRAAQKQLNEMEVTQAAVANKQAVAAAATSTLTVRPVPPYQRQVQQMPTNVQQSPNLQQPQQQPQPPQQRIVRRVIGNNVMSVTATTVPSSSVGGSQPAAAMNRSSPAAQIPANQILSKPKRWTNASGLTISPIVTTVATTPATTSAAMSAQQRSGLYATAAQNRQKSTNVVSANATASGATIQATKTPVQATIVRQNTQPQMQRAGGGATTTTATGAAATAANGTTIIRQMPNTPASGGQRPLPPLVRQNTAPAMQQQQPQQIIRAQIPAGAKIVQQQQQQSSPQTPAMIRSRNLTVRQFASQFATTAVGATAATGTAATTTTVPMPQNIRLPAGATISPTNVRVVNAPTTPSAANNLRQTLSAGQVVMTGGGVGGRAQIVAQPHPMQQQQQTVRKVMVQQQQQQPQVQQQQRFGTQQTYAGRPMAVANSSAAAGQRIASPAAGQSTIRMVQVPAPAANQSAATASGTVVNPAALATRKRKLPAGMEQMPSVSITEIKRAKVGPAGATVSLAATPQRVAVGGAMRQVNISQAAVAAAQQQQQKGGNSFQEISIVRKVTTLGGGAGGAASQSTGAVVAAGRMGGAQAQARGKAKQPQQVTGIVKLD